MLLLLVGLSHKTAPVEIREKIAFSENKLVGALNSLLKYDTISEAVIISTCNRSEIYVATNDIDKGKKNVIDFLSSYHGLKPKEITDFLYFKIALDVVYHLFRVASSLDSMVVGEAQILGQVKEAYTRAFEAGATNVILNRLFRHAFSVGKRVRTETEIGESAVSISYAAVELAKKVFENLEGKTIMIIGAGKMSELTAKHLLASGVTSVIVSNRTYDKATELAKQFNGRAVRFDEYINYMVEADIVISSTGAPHYVIKKEDVVKVMQLRKHKPIFFIDIAVPRDVEPEVNNVYNAYLYDIDDLESVVEVNILERKREAEKSETIVNAEVEDFFAWLNVLEVAPTIAALKEMAE
ncbi:MAG: glutamyl-tRNA reductase, partial [Candidatus Subteraquimicrobiales bacterium]|nr:glutamyl-tRNA reductase [Candidatus Subteraquimicrobiales bacterium]